jgi:hypothetical protein
MKGRAPIAPQAGMAASKLAGTKAAPSRRTAKDQLAGPYSLAPAIRRSGKRRVVAHAASFVGYLYSVSPGGGAAKCAKMPHLCAFQHISSILLTH